MPRRIRARLLLFACSALLNPGTRAQTDIAGEVRTENGMHRATFRVPQGVIRVNFPDDLSRGDTISGSVYNEPSGKNPKALQKNSGEITGYVVEMPGEKAKTSDKRFRWSVPAAVAGGLTPILLRDNKNRIVSRCDLPVNPGPPGPPPAGIDLPLGAQAESFVSAWGPFGGPAETTVRVGGRDADIIAESPRKMIFQIPADVVGQSTLQVRKGNLSASGSFSTLGMRVGVSKRLLGPGETAVLTVTVSGLEGPQEPASLVIVNHNPGVAALGGGTVLLVPIQPAEVRADGTFELTRTLTGIKVGDFNLTVTATRPPTALLPIDRLSGRTVDQWSLAQRVPVSADARSLIVSGVAGARPQLDKLLLPQLAFRADPGTELDWLVREYCFDLRDRKLIPGRLAAFSRHSPFASSFVPQGPPVRGDISLDSSDVRKFSFSQFLGQLLNRWTPSDPLGNLLVTSKPDQQAIAIDHATGADYFTTRSFVLSVGTHTIHVASCNRSVTVNPNQQTTVSCPP